MRGHLDPEVLRVNQAIRERLRALFDPGEGALVAALAGSGSLGMEAGLANLDRGPVLVLVNGAFSQRVAEMAALHGLEPTVLEFPPGEPVDPERVAGRPHIIRAFVPTKYDARTAGDNRVLDTIKELEEIAPVAPRIAYRPGPHRRATEEQVPIQLTGDKEAAEEIAKLADFLLKEVFRYEEVVA
jgi:hypothetical protein